MSRRRKNRKLLNPEDHSPLEIRATHQTSKILKLLDSIRPTNEVKPNRELTNR